MPKGQSPFGNDDPLVDVLIVGAGAASSGQLRVRSSPISASGI